MLDLGNPLWRVQLLASVASLLFLFGVVRLIRRGRMKEEYGVLWLLGGGALLVVSLWREGLALLAGLLGIDYAPSALLLVLVAIQGLLLFHFSLVVSEHRGKLKEVVQELAAVKWELERMRRSNGDHDETRGGAF